MLLLYLMSSISIVGVSRSVVLTSMYIRTLFSNDNKISAKFLAHFLTMSQYANGLLNSKSIR